MDKLSNEELVLLENHMNKLEQINYLKFRVIEANKIINFLEEKEDWDFSNYNIIEEFKRKTDNEEYLVNKLNAVRIFNCYNYDKENFKEFIIINKDCKFNPISYLTNSYYRQSLVLSKAYHKYLDSSRISVFKRGEFAIKYRDLIMEQLSNGVSIKETIKTLKI